MSAEGSRSRWRARGSLSDPGELTGERSGRPRPVFEKLGRLADRHELRLELHTGGEGVYVRVSDGADGSSGSCTPDVSRLDEAAAAVILSLARAGIR